MTARRTTRKAASTDVIIPADDDVTRDVVMTDAVPAPTKYMSHENCDHARKGEAGKAARQVCRRNHRAWFAAEAAYLESLNEVPVAV